MIVTWKNPGDPPMKRIKVIHVITRFDKGGSAENTFLTVRGLDKDLYDVLLVAGSSHESVMGEDERNAVDHNLSEAKASGVRIMTIGSLVRNVRPFKDIVALRTMAALFRKERPDIVHTHTSKAGILGRWAAWMTKVPVIVHTPHGHVFWGYFNRISTFFFLFLERWSARITDKIIALTEQEKRDHLHFNIATEDKFDVIHSGVDLDKFLRVTADPLQIKKRLGVPAHVPIVGTIGRLTRVKGHRYLIEAAQDVLKEYPEACFLFLGDGELLQELHSLATERGIGDRVIFLGWRPDVADILSIFDIFVFPSLNEGMGKAVVEAMALGKPVIASRVGGLVDLVHEGRNGILVPPADAGALACGIKSLMGDPEKRIQSGREGMALAPRFGSDSMVSKIDSMYRNLMSLNFRGDSIETCEP
jgi:glycosyltransferase involved in cell wall biosynthesis